MVWVHAPLDAPAGYVNPIRLAEFPADEATVLTPEPSLAALRNGYSAAVHSSAAQQGLSG
jgi:hypothetical protein